MKLIKNKNLKYLLIVITIVLILFMSVITSKAQEQITEPIMYDFENDSILDINQENNPNYYNIRNQTYYNSSEYSVIESFEYNDISDLSSEWNISEQPINSYVSLTTEFDDNNKALILTNENNSDSLYLTRIIDDITIGVIEMFVRVNSSSDYFAIHLQESNSTSLSDGIRILFGTSGYIAFYEHISGWTNLQTYHNNFWYHLKISFDFSGTIWNFTINGIEYVSLTYYGNPSYTSCLLYRIYPDTKIHIDNIDYDWNNYDYYDNRNQLPNVLETNQLEVDKYEFDYEYGKFEANNTYDFYEFEYDDTTDDVSVIDPDTQDINKYIDIWTPSQVSTYTNGIEYHRNSNNFIINVSINFEINMIDTYCAHFFHIYPQNWSYKPIQVRFNGNGQTITIYNILDDGWIDDGYTFTTSEYTLEFYLNYYYDIMTIRLSDTSEIFKLIFPLDDDNYWNGMYGLDKIKIYNSMSSLGTLAEMFVNSVGIYENGISFKSDNDNNGKHGLMYYQVDSQWNSDNHNLLTIDSKNDYELYINSYYQYYLDGFKPRERSNQTESEITNFQDSIDNNNPEFVYDNPYLIFRVFDNCTNFYEIEIEGIKLTDDDDNYVYPNYYYNNSNPNDNWFYVVDNKLFYHFNNSENNYTETMRISFNVNDVLLDNESLISYSSYITNNYSGNLYISSYHNTEVFDILENSTVQNTYLNLTDTEHFTLKEILIEIYTNNNSNDLPNGYIQNINVYPEKPLFPDFEPIVYLDSTFLEKMIETIIPILFFIVPSLIIRTKYGSKAVIPIWILITFVLLISNFIPFWICFIIFLSIGLMMISKKEALE